MAEKNGWLLIDVIEPRQMSVVMVGGRVRSGVALSSVVAKNPISHCRWWVRAHRPVGVDDRPRRRTVRFAGRDDREVNDFSNTSMHCAGLFGNFRINTPRCM